FFSGGIYYYTAYHTVLMNQIHDHSWLVSCAGACHFCTFITRHALCICAHSCAFRRETELKCHFEFGGVQIPSYIANEKLTAGGSRLRSLAVVGFRRSLRYLVFALMGSFLIPFALGRSSGTDGPKRNGTSTQIIKRVSVTVAGYPDGPIL